MIKIDNQNGDSAFQEAIDEALEILRDLKRESFPANLHNDNEYLTRAIHSFFDSNSDLLLMKAFYQSLDAKFRAFIRPAKIKTFSSPSKIVRVEFDDRSKFHFDQVRKNAIQYAEIIKSIYGSDYDVEFIGSDGSVMVDAKLDF